MITDKLLTGFFQIGASIGMAILSLYITFSYLYKRIFIKYKITIDNTAYAIFASAIIFSVSLLISGTSPSVITTSKILSSKESGFQLWTDLLRFTGVFMFIALLTSLLINLISYFLFTRLTRKVDEFEEIQKNNVAVGVITGVIVISITLIVKDSLVYIIESLVPYPAIPAVY